MHSLLQKIKQHWQIGGVVLFLSLLFAAYWLLFTSKSSESILSPWQVIHPAYIYVFFGTTLVLGFLIVFAPYPSLYPSPKRGGARGGVALLLFFFILYSFLLHSYLPATHKLLYGADQWRHIANESQIMDGHWPAKVSLRQETNTTSYKLQATTFEVGDLAYSGFWVLGAGVSKASGLDLITINKWMLPILWSLLFPILMYAIGRALGWSEKVSLFAVWFSNVPFALQAAGSFTLPVNLGFLVWLGGVLLILRRIANPGRKQLIWLSLFGVLSIFNYSLFFILFWLGWVVAEVIVRLRFRLRLASDAVFTVGLVLFVGLALPVLEIITGYGNLNLNLNLFTQLKQLIGNFLGIYIASGPRPHDIATGNILFNQMPSYAFVQNVFTAWRWWIPVFALGFWVAFKAGLWVSLKKNAEHLWLFVMTYALFISYILSRYFMVGEQVLTRRLDVVLAFLAIIVAVVGLRYVVHEIRNRKYEIGRVAVIFPVSCFLFIIIMSISITSSYSLGPDTETVSLDEYTAMEYIWGQEKDSGHPCVIAQTYPLLALEAISKKHVVGGGFPINATFAQPEREEVLQKLDSAETIETGLVLGIKATGASSCWVVTESDPERDRAFAGLVSEQKIFGETFVWRYFEN